MTFHFEPTAIEWTEKEVMDFSNLMLSGGARLDKLDKPLNKPITSTLAQSKVRKIGELSYTPIDRVAQLVAAKLTCRICGKVDFARKISRQAHETVCKKQQAELARIERNNKANRKLEIKWGLAEGELGNS